MNCNSNKICFCHEQAMSSLGVLAETTGRTVTDIMEPHKNVLHEMVPPKKHLLRHQPLNTQIGLMVTFHNMLYVFFFFFFWQISLFISELLINICCTAYRVGRK